jgi:hypothetical protein
MRKSLLLLLALSFSLAAAAPAIDTDALLREAFPPSPSDEGTLRAASGAVGLETGVGHGHEHSEAPEVGVFEVVSLGACLLVLSQALRRQKQRQ